MAARHIYDAQSAQSLQRNMNTQYITMTTITQSLTHASQVGDTQHTRDFGITNSGQSVCEQSVCEHKTKWTTQS